MKMTTSPENLRIISALENYIAENSLNTEVIAYTDLNHIAGTDVQKKRRYLLDRAIEKAEKRCGCIFSCSHGVGIRRLIADETPNVGSQAIRRTRRGIGKALKRIVRVNTNEMSPTARQYTVLKACHLNNLHALADNRRTETFVAATADPYAAKKAYAG